MRPVTDVLGERKLALSNNIRDRGNRGSREHEYEFAYAAAYGMEAWGYV